MVDRADDEIESACALGLWTSDLSCAFHLLLLALAFSIITLLAGRVTIGLEAGLIYELWGLKAQHCANHGPLTDRASCLYCGYRVQI